MKITDTEENLKKLQEIESKANGLPCCASRYNPATGRWENDPDSVGATCVSHVVKLEDGTFEMELSSDYADSDKLTSAEKKTLKDAKDKAEKKTGKNKD